MTGWKGERCSRLQNGIRKGPLILLSSLLLGMPLVRSQMEDSIMMDRIVAAAEYQDCLDDLYAADVDNDLGLDTEEYVNYVEIRSSGRIAVDEYEQLPLSLISNFVFAACLCSYLFDESDCCVGDDAVIDLNPDSSPFIEDSVMTFCYNVDIAIALELIPTNAPTVAPVAATFSPSNIPTEAPTPKATTLAPTNAPTNNPTKAPTNNPTKAPTNNPTEAPTNNPTKAPTNNPTKAPTNNPTKAPTNNPTEAPTNNPTEAPTFKPTEGTPRPTPESTICAPFEYGISNDAGFTASDIFFEVNNTLKTGLLIATRTVTIETLNATYPRDESSRFLNVRREKARNHLWAISGDTDDHDLSIHHGEFGNRIRHVISLNELSPAAMKLVGEGPLVNGDRDEGRRRLAYLSSNQDVSPVNIANVGSRRLVFYTDDYPVQITAMLDNPFCNKPTPDSQCAIVASAVCVLLEEGDDEEEVRVALLAGIGKSIFNGDFEAAIPPENQLPDN